jgi:hypothetical protein
VLVPDKLYPMLGNTPGVGLKSVAAAALLLLAAVFVRACLWPFTAWQTGTVEAPPAALALVAGVWPVMAGSLLLRALPVLGAAGWQAPRIATIALVVAAVMGPLLGLIGVELRRSLLLASSGAVALALLGMLSPASAPVAFTGLLAAAAGRTGALLAGSAAAASMRTVDLRAMGAGWERMPATALGLLASVAAVALAGCGAFALRPRSLEWVAFGAGVALVAVAVLRVYFAMAHGPLRRRRAFEPGRVREAAPGVTGPALMAGLVGLAAVALTFLTAWVGFLESGRQAVFGMGTNVLWVASLAVGAGLAAFLFGYRKEESLAVSARLGELLGALWELAAGVYDRFFARPEGQAVQAAEGVALPTLESGVGQALTGTGSLADRTVPWVPALLGLAAVLALAFGILSQLFVRGVLR